MPPHVNMQLLDNIILQGGQEQVLYPGIQAGLLITHWFNPTANQSLKSYQNRRRLIYTPLQQS